MIENLEVDAEGAMLDEDESDDEFFSDEFSDDSGICVASQSPFNQLKRDMTPIYSGIWKKIVTEAPADAEKVDIARHRVEYRYSLYQEGVVESFDSNYRKRKCAILDIYDKRQQSTLQGMIEAIGSMKDGEKSLFIITFEKMFKALGCPPRVGEKADILAEINVCSVTEIGDDEKIRLLTSNIDEFHKLQGTFADALLRASNAFKQGSFKVAIGLYKKVLSKALFAKTRSADEKREREEIINKTYLNIAICYNVLEEYREALTNLEMVEQLSKTSVPTMKFLYTKGKALMMLSEYAKAEKVINAGFTREPANTSMHQLLKELKNRMAVENANSKAFAKKFIVG